jgi:outer membrane immunogenic protein
MLMHRFSLALTAVVSTAAVIQIASAADLPVKAPIYKAPSPVAVYNWSGCYLGGNLGAAWGHSNVTTTYSDPSGPNAFLDELTAGHYPSLHSSGVAAGGQIGCNLQSNHLVAGLETDINYFGLEKDISSTMSSFKGIPLTNQSVTTNSSISAHWLFTLRGRLGYALDTWLVYVTGGLATTRIQGSSIYQNVVVSPPHLAEGEAAGASGTKAGWTVGAGIEHAFNRNWTSKLEYLYADFGSITASGQLLGETGPSGITLTHNFTLATHIVRAGLNYKFNSN